MVLYMEITYVNRFAEAFSMTSSQLVGKSSSSDTSTGTRMESSSRSSGYLFRSTQSAWTSLFQALISSAKELF